MATDPRTGGQSTAGRCASGEGDPRVSFLAPPRVRSHMKAATARLFKRSRPEGSRRRSSMWIWSNGGWRSHNRVMRPVMAKAKRWDERSWWSNHPRHQ